MSTWIIAGASGRRARWTRASTNVGEMTGPFRGVDDRSEYPCSCGAKLSECPFWTDVGAKAFGGWDRVDGLDWLELKTRPAARWLKRVWRLQK